MTMKLSEAIRLGAMLRPQSHGAFFKQGGSCAAGAALEAVGFPYTDGWDHGWTASFEKWPFLFEAYMGCPDQTCDRVNDIGTRLIDRITHLNDGGHRWTRERIADWVATIEPRGPEPVPEPVPAMQEVANE